MTETNELFLARQDIFVREAREACHKSLFFLGMLYEADLPKTTKAIKDYSPFAMHQVKGLIKGVHIPDAWKKKAAELKPVDEAAKDGETPCALPPSPNDHTYVVMAPVEADPLKTMGVFAVPE